MIAPTTAERALYADLTQLMMRMKGESLALVEAAIEERFQAFVREQKPGRTSRLQIIQTYVLHDDDEPWAEYQTEYRIDAAPLPNGAAAQVASTTPLPNPLNQVRGNVVPFSRAFASARSACRHAPDAAQPTSV